jgi:predicted patatin/cPLA2 family phospholipase
MEKSNRSALIVEGGAMRSIFSAGLLDGFLAQNFNPFDFYMGVSAGACNLVAYLAGTPRRSLRIYQEYALQNEFIDYMRFARGGHLLDLDWLSQMIFKPDRLDVDAVFRNQNPMYVCVTDVETGLPAYIKAGPENVQQLIKASTALPLLYRGFPEIKGKPMTDGGVADGIPVAESIRMGAKQIMVIRSRPKSYIKKDSLGHKYIRWKMRRYPRLRETMRQRIKIYETYMMLKSSPPKGVSVIEICPPESFTLSRFSRNRRCLEDGYQAGFDMAKNVINKWHKKTV